MNELLFQLYSKYWDGMIQNIYKADVENIEGSDGLLDQLVFKNPDMPIAFRTNHPRYLQSIRKYKNIAEIISDIIAHI